MRFLWNIQAFKAQVSSIDCQSFNLPFLIDENLGIFKAGLQLYENVPFNRNINYMHKNQNKMRFLWKIQKFKCRNFKTLLALVLNSSMFMFCVKRVFAKKGKIN